MNKASIPVEEHLKELLKDSKFRELYEISQQKLKIVKPIIAYRIKHGLNQKQLARKVGVSQQHISKIEWGEFENIKTLEKVLSAIGYMVQMKAVPIGLKTAARKRPSRRSKPRRRVA